MSTKRNDLAIKKARLQAEASLQRKMLSTHASDWQMRLKWLDKGLAATRFVKNNPGMILGAGALFAFFTPIKAARMILGSWAALKGMRKLSGIFSKD
jgi:YqjK-like protein